MSHFLIHSLLQEGLSPEISLKISSPYIIVVIVKEQISQSRIIKLKIYHQQKEKVPDIQTDPSKTLFVLKQHL